MLVKGDTSGGWLFHNRSVVQYALPGYFCAYRSANIAIYKVRYAALSFCFTGECVLPDDAFEDAYISQKHVSRAAGIHLPSGLNLSHTHTHTHTHTHWWCMYSSVACRTQVNLVCVHIDGLLQERRNSSALAMELRLSCTNPSIYWLIS